MKKYFILIIFFLIIIMFYIFNIHEKINAIKNENNKLLEKIKDITDNTIDEIQKFILNNQIKKNIINNINNDDENNKINLSPNNNIFYMSENNTKENMSNTSNNFHYMHSSFNNDLLNSLRSLSNDIKIIDINKKNKIIDTKDLTNNTNDI